MKKKLLAMAFVAALLVISVIPAFAGAPSFAPELFADDAVWGTKATTPLPAPNGNNAHSFDGLFTFPESGAEGQLPVAEAAPGNPAYNGGRWSVNTVTWNSTPELVTSYAQLMALEAAGAVSIAEAGVYFQCPLLPVH